MNKLLLATAIAGTSAMIITPEHMQAFTDFTTKYEKTYADDAEWAKRLGVFTENFEKVTNQNRDHLLLGGEAVFGITKFMDLTPDEFKSTYLTYIPRDESTLKRTDVIADGVLADSVDWRKKGAVTAVKDQGQCGSCWAFSATEAIESYAFLAGHGLQELSAQEINSCDKVDLGCNGGNSETAYEFVVKNGGISTEKAYPYTSGGGRTGLCQSKGKTSAIKIKGYTSVKKGEKNLKNALNHGPVSICLAADAFQTYSGGILKSCPGEIDHCVQAVGYSTEGKYWIVRNSWNTDWGEDGFIRVQMGDNLCHIGDDVTFPTF